MGRTECLPHPKENQHREKKSICLQIHFMLLVRTPHYSDGLRVSNTYFVSSDRSRPVLLKQHVISEQGEQEKNAGPPEYCYGQKTGIERVRVSIWKWFLAGDASKRIPMPYRLHEHAVSQFLCT